MSRTTRRPPGKLVGQARGQVNRAFAARESAIVEAEDRARLEAERVDVTALRCASAAGARHPLSLLQDQSPTSSSAWAGRSPEGPELESEWFNFDALNFDAGPPRARHAGHLLRRPARGAPGAAHPHEPGAGALHARARAADLRVAPGRVFRTDELDATHTAGVHPVRGPRRRQGPHHGAPARHPGALRAQLFGDEAQIRLRPNYFPFTEPSAELDVWHPTFKGGARWIEWGGCGMVNPNVLRAAGIDPDVYQGFAFGMGIERALMFRNDVKTCATWSRAMSGSASSSEWWSDARPTELARRVRRPARDARRARPRGPRRVGFEEEDVHTFELTGPVVVGEVLEFVEEPQSNGKTIHWCQVRRRRGASRAASSAARATSSSATRSS